MVVILLGNCRIRVKRKGRFKQNPRQGYSDFFVGFNLIALFQRLELLSKGCGHLGAENFRLFFNINYQNPVFTLSPRFLVAEVGKV